MYTEDDDLHLVSDGEVDLIEISSDSSPEVHSRTQDSRRMPNKELHSSQIVATSTQARLHKAPPQASSKSNTSSSKTLTSDDDELPDLTDSQPPIKSCCEDNNRVEDNLSDISTIIFDDMNLDEWMDDDFENMATSTSSSGSTEEVLSSISYAGTAASHDQTESTITSVIDNLEVVTLPCAEQCMNSTTEEKQSDTVQHVIMNHPETEEKSNPWPAKNSDTTPQQDVQSDKETQPTSDEIIPGNDKMNEAAPVNNVHGKNIEVTKEDNIKQVKNDQLQTNGEDGVMSEKGKNNAMTIKENEVTEAVFQKVTQSKSTEEEAPHEGNEPPAVSPTSPPNTNNTSITETSDDAGVTRKASMDPTTPRNPNNPVVGEIDSSPLGSTKEENTSNIRTLVENDKTMQDSITPVNYSEKKRKLKMETKGKKKKRLAKLKKVQEQERMWGGHSGGDEDCLEVVDPSCTLFVSDGQLVVAMRVPRSTEREEENVVPREKSDEAQVLLQHSICSPASPNFPLHLCANSPQHSPPTTIGSPKEIRNACERNEHQAAKIETVNATVSLEECIDLQDKQQANVEWEETREIHEKSDRIPQGNEGHGEEIHAREMKETACKEEANQMSESFVDESKMFENRVINNPISGETNKTEEINATRIPLLYTSKMYDETIQDTEKANETLSTRDEILCEANKGSECIIEAMLKTNPELHQTLSEAPEENHDTGNINDENVKILTQDNNSNAKMENTTLVALMHEKERKTTPQLVPKVPEKRGIPEQVPEEEKRITVEKVPGTEEENVTPDRIHGVEDKRENPERVPKEEKSVILESESVVKERILYERAPEVKTQGPEKDAVKSSEFSGNEEDGGCVGQVELATKRNANGNSTSISHLAECLVALRLRGQLTHPLTYPQTHLNAASCVSIDSDSRPSVGQGDFQTQNVSPIPMDSASLCRQRHMDAFKGLVEELSLMGERRMKARHEEKLGVNDAQPVEPEELPHVSNQRSYNGRKGKEDSTGLTIIQCVAEVHHSADAEIKDLNDIQFKQPQSKVQCKAPLNNDDSKQLDREKQNEIADKANKTEGMREEELNAYKPLRMEGDMKSNMGEIKEDLECIQKDMVVETEVHNGETPGLGDEVDEKEIGNLPSSGSTRTYLQEEELCVSFGPEGRGSAVPVNVCEDLDFKHNDIPSVIKTKGSEHLIQGSGECGTAGKDDHELTPPPGINIKVINNIPAGPDPQPSPPPSVNNFVRQVSMKIDQLHAESSVVQAQQGGSQRPREFSHTLQNFMESIHCGEEAHERHVPVAAPTGSSMVVGLDQQHHGGDMRVPSPHLSPNRFHPSSSVNWIQPAVSGIQPVSSGTQPGVSRTQPAVSGFQPVSSVTQLVVSGTQPWAGGTQPAIDGIQTAVGGTHPAFSKTQLSLSEIQPAIARTHPSATDVHLSSSVVQTSTHQTQPSTNASEQSSKITPPTASETHITRERERRWREESADEESEVEGSRGRKRRRKAHGTTRHHIVEVLLNGESLIPFYPTTQGEQKVSIV